MKVDCQWMNRNLEAYFCDNLNTEESDQARRHMDTCVSCRNEVQAVRNIDSLVKNYFQQEVALARAPRKQRLAWYGPAAAAVALTLLLVGVVSWVRPEPVSPTANVSGGPTIPVEGPASEVSKDPAPPAEGRSKPIAPDQVATPPGAAVATSERRVDEFLVTDPAGYSRSLKDYRGYVLLMGVWSLQEPRTITALEQLYRTFGSETRLRILGVAEQRQTKPPSSTFPVAYNQGSRLLNAGPSGFVLVDETGGVRLRGSLLDDLSRITSSVRAELH